MVRNPLSFAEAYSLQLIPKSEKDENIFTEATVTMTMTPTIYTDWLKGGSKGQNIKSTKGSNVITLENGENIIDNICLQANEADFIVLNFKFKSSGLLSSKYSLDLIQRNLKGKIVGGQSIIVESPVVGSRFIEILTDNLGGGFVQLTTADELTDFSWENSLGDVISTSESVVVQPTLSNTNYRVNAITEEGEYVSGEITVDVPNGIQSLSANPTGIIVILKEAPACHSQIKLINSLNSSIELHTDVPAYTNEISIDTNSLIPGLYILQYVVDSTVVDIRKIKID